MTAHVQVPAENLYKAVRATRQKGWIKSLPVLTHAHIFTRDGRVWVETTNLETPLGAKVAARVLVNDAVNTCVPFKPFLAWLQISAKSKDLLELTYDAQIATLRVCICQERTRAEFKCIDAREFPPIPETAYA